MKGGAPREHGGASWEHRGAVSKQGRRSERERKDSGSFKGA